MTSAAIVDIGNGDVGRIDLRGRANQCRHPKRALGYPIQNLPVVVEASRQSFKERDRSKWILFQ